MNKKYNRVISNKNGEIEVDVYDVLVAFGVRCPALQHLAKKALNAGLRGHKNVEQDLYDIRDSADRAIELHKHKKEMQEKQIKGVQHG